MFHSQGKTIEDADKWDYYSDDDDVLIAVTHYIYAHAQHASHAHGHARWPATSLPHRCPRTSQRAIEGQAPWAHFF